MVPALVFPEDHVLEAGDGPGRRAQRAGAAGREVLGSRTRLERDAAEQILKRLQTLKAGLQQRLLAGDGSLTDFRRFNLQTLLADTDKLIAEATADLAEMAQGTYRDAAKLGDDHASEPLKAAQLNVGQATPGLDAQLVQAAFGNTVDLLSPPMQQFGTDVKVALRRVALAGENRFEELARLRDKIGGAGFDSAQYKAERIIRTELSRTFNEATYGRLVTLSKDFPFLRKGWRDSKDSRVRTGHTEAGRTYARGKGIPVPDLFVLNVYDERGKGKAPKLIGQATLRFPVDPQAAPPGRLAAASTILCRCNSFVDFDMADFASYTKARVSAAVGQAGPVPVPAVPTPTLPAAAKVPKPRKPRAVKAPKVAVPTAADVMPVKVPTVPAGPTGPKVSSAINVEAGFDKVAAALAEIDKLHGDGQLPTIPAGAVASRYRRRAAAYYMSSQVTGRSIALGFSKKLLGTTPYMTTFHETGHFLDHKGFGAAGASFASDTPMGLATAGQREAFAGVMKAIQGTKSIQTLKTWQDANIPTGGSGNKLGTGAPANTYGDGVVPLGVDRTVVNYLLSTHESFARAYAQYVATKSGNAAALKELRNMQAASVTATRGPIARTTPYNRNSVTEGKKPQPDTWSYPWQWADDDFKPVLEAFDKLMGEMGWRK